MALCDVTASKSILDIFSGLLNAPPACGCLACQPFIIFIIDDALFTWCMKTEPR